MARPKEQLEALLRLPAADRSTAAEAPLTSPEEAGAVVDDEIQRAWVDEIERRINEGSAGVSADRVFAEGRARL